MKPTNLQENSNKNRSIIGLMPTVFLATQNLGVSTFCNSLKLCIPPTPTPAQIVWLCVSPNPHSN